MDRVFYEIDPFNRLIIKSQPGKRSRVRKFRQKVYGRFRTGANNSLFYEVNKSQDIDVPQKIKFSGKYSLDKEHNLIIALNKWNNQCEGNRLALKAKIIDAKSNEIAFLVNSKASDNRGLTYIIKFYGTWQADRNNRLTFGVERERDNADTLILSGAWEINKNNEIIYRYGKLSQAITFRGSWDFSNRHSVNYVLDKTIDSGFNFKASLGTLMPKSKETYVTFDIGIGVSNRRKLRRKVMFSGKWKMGKSKELIFETSDAEEGGATLRFTKEMFNRQDGMAYIEAIVKREERYIGGGITFRW